MIEKNNLAKIYKAVGRSSESYSGVNFKGFQETLFRIAVKSKELLNDIAAKKKQTSKLT